MERRWNDPDNRNPKDWEEILFHCKLVDHKSHINKLWLKPGPSRQDAGVYKPETLPITLKIFRQQAHIVIVLCIYITNMPFLS